MVENPEAAARSDPQRSALWFAAFKCPDGGEAQYFIFIEQKILCAVQSFSKALMLWFTSHYVFNLEYGRPVKEVAIFLKNLCSTCQTAAKSPQLTKL